MKKERGHTEGSHTTPMRTVGVRELKERTSEILREVQAGQVVDVTNRGTTIARLVPVRQSALSDEEIEVIILRESAKADFAYCSPRVQSPGNVCIQKYR